MGLGDGGGVTLGDADGLELGDGDELGLGATLGDEDGLGAIAGLGLGEGQFTWSLPPFGFFVGFIQGGADALLVTSRWAPAWEFVEPGGVVELLPQAARTLAVVNSPTANKTRGCTKDHLNHD